MYEALVRNIFAVLQIAHLATQFSVRHGTLVGKGRRGIPGGAFIL
jgi:hypothetical protein